ncbi:MAG: FAD-binding protein [Caldilineaceae bacterium]|nr:FAD-binding protein [Caldilineaceae bacterium]
MNPSPAAAEVWEGRATPLSQAQMVAGLQAIVSPERVLHTAAQRTPFESDGLTAFRERPGAVVLVDSTDEVVAAVRWCHETGTPCMARGSGTSLSGGAVPIPGGVVLALNRLNRVLDIRPTDRICRVEPGVINLDVSKAVAAHGLYYAPDPSSQPICTIGGNVAFNSGGAHCLKYGMTSNHVLGMKIVLPDGTVEELGRDSLEGVGPDLPGLFVGSEGRFGIALEVTLRLLPLVPSYRTVLAAYHSLGAAGEAVAAIVASGLLPGAIEIMDSLSIEAAEVSVQPGYPKAAAILIVELEGEPVQVEAEMVQLDAILRESGSHEIRPARTEAERQLIWKGRKSAFSAVGRLSPDFIVQDGVVPRTRLGEALEFIDRLSTRYGIRVANVFHAGDGNLHPLILYDGREPDALHRAEELAGEILTMCIDMGGSITGEHGVGREKLAYLPHMYTGADLALLHNLRKAVDPGILANRGKMLTDDLPSGHSGSEPVDPPEQWSDDIRTRVHALQESIRSHDRVAVRGAGSKAVHAPDGPTAILDAGALAGVLEYNPAEFTITVLAGSRVADIQDLLAAEGQVLPFDPPREGNATLGGTIACALGGEGRWRYGGLRDFILGLRFLDGRGELLYSGSRVVKNAAGFDLPKLMAGSLGSLALIVEATFKVFPCPEASGTVSVSGPLSDLLDTMAALSCGRHEIASLVLDTTVTEPVLHIRQTGRADQLPARLEDLQHTLGGSGSLLLEDQALWSGMSEWSRDRSETVIRVPVCPSRIQELAQGLAPLDMGMRWGSGGHLLWLSGDWQDRIEQQLAQLGLTGVVLRGPRAPRLIGAWREPRLLSRVRSVLDPDGKLVGGLPNRRN